MNKRIQNLFMEYHELENEYTNLIYLIIAILDFHIYKFFYLFLQC